MRILTQEQFIGKSKKIHGDRYDYSQVIYVRTRDKVIIGCCEHGLFSQTPASHLKGQGCPRCGGTGKLNTQLFIEKARNIHGEKYHYDRVNYQTRNVEVEIVCPKHGSFWQTPHDHVSSRAGCSICKNEACSTRLRSNLTDFVSKAKSIHGDSYDYSLFIYNKSTTRGIIVCKKHGEFKQTPSTHLMGAGCPRCNESRGERTILGWLRLNNYEFDRQHKIVECCHKRPLPFDFAVFNNDGSLKCLIEYQGKQHFEPVNIFGGQKKFEGLQLRDQIKRNFCENKKIPLYSIGYKENIINSLEKYLCPAF